MPDQPLVIPAVAALHAIPSMQNFGTHSASPMLMEARARIEAINPDSYARTRNFLTGAVSRLSPYITHGIVSTGEVLAGVDQKSPLSINHKFVYELGWRHYFRHVWQHRGNDIFTSFHNGPLPDAHYALALPEDIRQGCTGVPVIDSAVRELYSSGLLHNHARMWLASYVTHLRKVHWRIGADWLYGHLLDGDLASNHLSWQWVAGTSSQKPYLFNADNVARYAPPAWHSRDSILDTSYEALDQIARNDTSFPPAPSALRSASPSEVEPRLIQTPPDWIGVTSPQARAAEGRDIWLAHPWNLSEPPIELPAGTVVICILLSDFHVARPWSEQRWHFVGTRMQELSAIRWYGDSTSLGKALQGARRVLSRDDPHISHWLTQWAHCLPDRPLFPCSNHFYDSFSQWWKQVSAGLRTANELLSNQTTHTP